jgi:hypothetical protein
MIKHRAEGHGAEDRKQKLRRREGEMRQGRRTGPSQIKNVKLFDVGLEI